MCMDKFENCSYTKRIWCIFEAWDCRFLKKHARKKNSDSKFEDVLGLDSSKNLADWLLLSDFFVQLAKLFLVLRSIIDETCSF